MKLVVSLLVAANLFLALWLGMLRSNESSQSAVGHQSIGDRIILASELPGHQQSSSQIPVEPDSETTQQGLDSTVQAEIDQSRDSPMELRQQDSIETPGVEIDAESPSLSVAALEVETESDSTSQLGDQVRLQLNCDWLGPFRDQREVSAIMAREDVGDSELVSEQIRAVTAWQIAIPTSEGELVELRRQLDAGGIDNFASQSESGLELIAGRFSVEANADEQMALIGAQGIEALKRPLEELEEQYWIVHREDIASLANLTEALGARPFQIIEKSCPEVASQGNIQ